MTDGPATPSGRGTAAPALTGARRASLVGYQWLLLAFLLLGLVQVFLAGLGVFDLHGAEPDSEEAMETAFASHGTMAAVLAVVALLVFILACVAWPGLQAIVWSFVLFLLTYPVQRLLAVAGEDTPFFGGLHALDTFVILGLAGYLYWWARRRMAA